MIDIDTAFSVIYQDHYMLILNKQPGIVMHPTYKHVDGKTFWDALLLYLEREGRDTWQPPVLPDEPEWALAPLHIQKMLRQKRLERYWQEEGLLERPCLLHRLDKHTSGVVAVARTERSCRHLVKQFYAHTIVKRYLAVVQKGSPMWAMPRAPFTVRRCTVEGAEDTFDATVSMESLGSDELVLDGPLQRDPDDRRRSVVGPDGVHATTLVRVLVVERDYALLEVRPVTGRTHQIRAHLAALGYSIVGDAMYGLPTVEQQKEAALQRQFLHAYSLTLRRYPDAAECCFVAPLTSDLTDWMRRYFSTGLGVLNASTKLPA